MSTEPPAHLVEFAVEQAMHSPCRSKRGSVIFLGDDIVSHGYNYRPLVACDGSPDCKATCRQTAVHAEQVALLAAGSSRAWCADMLHVKAIDGKLVPSGGPSCVQCSKLGLVAGIAGIWLYHEDGWRRYSGEEWHRLSLLAGEGR